MLDNQNKLGVVMSKASEIQERFNKRNDMRQKIIKKSHWQNNGKVKETDKEAMEIIKCKENRR